MAVKNMSWMSVLAVVLFGLSGQVQAAELPPGEPLQNGPVAKALNHEEVVTASDVVSKARALNTLESKQDDIQIYGQLDLGRLRYADDKGSVIGTDFGLQVRLKNRAFVGADYSHAVGLGVAGSLTTGYVSVDLRPADVALRVQPFVQVGGALLDIEDGNQVGTAMVGIGATVALNEHLGLRVDSRLQQPLETVMVGSGEDACSYDAKDVHLFQNKIGFTVTW